MTQDSVFNRDCILESLDHLLQDEGFWVYIFLFQCLFCPWPRVQRGVANGNTLLHRLTFQQGGVFLPSDYDAYKYNNSHVFTLSVMPEHIIVCMDVMSKLTSLRVSHPCRLRSRHAQQNPRYGPSVRLESSVRSLEPRSSEPPSQSFVDRSRVPRSDRLL